jgi:hypothetical protein
MEPEFDRRKAGYRCQLASQGLKSLVGRKKSIRTKSTDERTNKSRYRGLYQLPTATGILIHTQQVGRSGKSLVTRNISAPCQSNPSIEHRGSSS